MNNGEFVATLGGSAAPGLSYPGGVSSVCMRDGLRFDPAIPGPKGMRIGPGLHFPILAEGLDLALHYGWFAEPARVGDSLDELREGQAAFTQQVLSLVAADAKRVLDVGTGRGETARALAARGAAVVTLSPDLNQGRWLGRAPHPGIRFQSFALRGLSRPRAKRRSLRRNRVQ